jgi:hypothetical protein
MYASCSLRVALAAWLLLTNLSLGLYHQHGAEAAAPSPVKEHRTSPEARHYHVLVLGIELEFLSLNSETSPFSSGDDSDGEAHLLLARLICPAAEHEPGPALALLIGCDLLTDAAFMCSGTHVTGQGSSLIARDFNCLSLPAVALGARSGVQQV